MKPTIESKIARMSQKSHGFQPLYNATMMALIEEAKKEEEKRKMSSLAERWKKVRSTNAKTPAAFFSELVEYAKVKETRERLERKQPGQRAKQAWRQVLRERGVDVVNPVQPGSFVPDWMCVTIQKDGKELRQTIKSLPYEIRRWVKESIKSANNRFEQVLFAA